MGVLDNDPFAPRVPPVESEPEPWVGVLAAVEQLAAAIRDAPPAPVPVVEVAPPDLSAVVQAVTDIKGPATADEIARALASVLRPSDAASGESASATMQQLAKVLAELDFRLKGIGVQAYGGGETYLSKTAIQQLADGIVVQADLTGVALETTQVAGNAVLEDIDGDIGDPTDAEAAADGSVIALLKRLRTLLGLVATEATQVNSNAILEDIDGDVEANGVTLASIDGHVDGLEALVTAGNSTLTTINSNVDGLETLVTTSNTILEDIDGDVETIMFGQAPTPANILCGSKHNNASGNLIVVPANRTWIGVINMSATMRVGAVNAAQDGFLQCSWTPGTSGTTAFVPAEIGLSVPATLLGALTGVQDSGQMATGEICLYAGTTQGTLTLTATSLTQFSAGASGYLV